MFQLYYSNSTSIRTPLSPSAPHAGILAGFSHSGSRHLFEVGAAPSEGLRRFAETGRGLRASGDWPGRTEDVLDVFVAPPIRKGVGRTTARLFADGAHSKVGAEDKLQLYRGVRIKMVYLIVALPKVSFISKMIPSPDWFIGIDSLELCREGKFLTRLEEEVTLLLRHSLHLFKSSVSSRSWTPWMPTRTRGSRSPRQTGPKKERARKGGAIDLI